MHAARKCLTSRSVGELAINTYCIGGLGARDAIYGPLLRFTVRSTILLDCREQLRVNWSADCFACLTIESDTREKFQNFGIPYSNYNRR